MQNPDRTNAISNEFHDFLADIETLLKQTATLTGDELSHAKEKLRERVAAAKVTAGYISGGIANDAYKVAATVNREVHAEPWKAIGAGAAVGILLGLLFARR